jgi:hypothetical protein
MEANMAQATVFIDDAVLSELPDICVKDGIETRDQLVISQDLPNRSGLGIGWLLLLAGPLGLIGLLFISGLRSRDETLTVTIPFSEAANKRLSKARNDSRGFGAGTIVIALAAFISQVHHFSSGNLIPIALTITALVTMAGWIVAHVRFKSAAVGIRLDASGRWVTLDRVCERFASAAARDLSHTHANRRVLTSSTL